jgi:adenylyltransferase/sulfurtransferase
VSNVAASISPLELAGRLRSPNPPRLLDVRQPEEHAVASLPGARLIPLHQLVEHASEIASWKDDEVVVYCHHGMRSLRATEILDRLGFPRVFNLTGGIDRWSLEVDPSLPRY